MKDEEVEARKLKSLAHLLSLIKWWQWMSNPGSLRAHRFNTWKKVADWMLNKHKTFISMVSHKMPWTLRKKSQKQGEKTNRENGIWFFRMNKRSSAEACWLNTWNATRFHLHGFICRMITETLCVGENPANNMSVFASTTNRNSLSHLSLVFSCLYHHQHLLNMFANCWVVEAGINSQL